MKTKTLINAINKTGLKIQTGYNNQQYVNGPKYCLSFYVQEDQAVCVHIARHGDESDSMRDYHAGFFVRTIKGAIEYLLEK